MDCNSNQRTGCTSRPQMTPPTYMNTGCVTPNMASGFVPNMGFSTASNVASGRTSSGMSEPNQINGTVLAMGYVPWQKWGQTYSLEQGLNRGTIFPELDLPFVMGRCRG